MRMRLLLILLTSFSVALAAACGPSGNTTQDRGRYIYDDAGRLPMESEIALAAYLWRLDEKTDYEIVFVFPKELLNEEDIITGFNNLGVGKKGRDNGAAVFVFPDNSVFVAIGSGNDKVSVTFSQSFGERIFRSINDDPVLTYLRFASAIGGKVDDASGTEYAQKAFNSIVEHLRLILLWTFVVALLVFAIQQLDGFQPHDLLMPVGVFLVVFLFIGISAIEPDPTSDYATYGVITSEKHESHKWNHIHFVSYPCGKSTCTTSYPHPHTTYTNDVTFLSYNSKTYPYRFETDESKSAWDHNVGELNELTVEAKTDQLSGTSGLSDKSGGLTKGDGVWIRSGMKK